MATYYQLTPFVPQFLDSSGAPLSGGTLNVYIAGTSTTSNLYTDDAGTATGSAIMLNSRGYPSVSGNIVLLYGLGGEQYKLVLKDSAGSTIYTIDDVQPLSGIGYFMQQGAGAVIRAVDDKLAECVSVKDYGATGDGSTDDADAIEAADTHADSARLPVFFPPGSYKIGRTITRKAQSAWFGLAQQSNSNINNETQIFGTVSDIGTGNPMIRCAAVGVGTSVASISFANLEFVSDKSVDFSNLSAVDSSGITLVDVSNVKNGCEFIGCSFKNAAFGIKQSDDDPYLDKVTLDRCHFTLLYKAIQCNPTGGLSLANCFIYDCHDWVYTKNGGRANGSEITLTACSFNNSSFSAEYCCITGSSISATGCWFEGGNHWFYPTKFAKAEGCYFSEAMSASGSTKFSAAPNDPGTNSCSFMFIGCKIATNTRMLDLSDVADATTMSVTCIGNYGGANFSDASDINTKLTAGLDYEGYGNVNSSSWNASQHNRKVAIGTKRGASNQLELQADGGGGGVYLRITDTASSAGIAGVILERSHTAAGDIKIEDKLGDLVISSATDGATWTEVIKLTAAGAVAIKDGITAPSTATGFAQLYVDTADGDLKVKFGDGTVKTIVVDT